ncbi:hypothetical protein [Paenibacillus turpanensis]|uniref:hypothetical protein n=1 Tax=Paenibacillus turpanensis TaxID=2689078 RepID=UPI00140A6CDB|nr:hypothetical protein [Paenibacillus turpanensis]
MVNQPTEGRWNRYKRINVMLLAAVSMLLVLILGGCGGGRPATAADGAALNPAAVKEAILIVQNGVEEYQKKTGVPPIKNSTEDTPIYEKYVIDMRKLVERHMISQIPTIAFENGGTYQFVLVHPETNPEVKLLDVAAFQKTSDLQKKIAQYAASNGGQLPQGDPVAPGYSRIDFTKLGVKEEQIRSPYSNQFITFVLSDKGEVGIDYALDIAMLVQKKSILPGEQDDLRELLVKEFPFIPVRSFPYRWINQEPVVQ